MSQDSDYVGTGTRFLLAVIVASMGMLVFMALPLWALIPVLVGLSWGAGWLMRRIYEQNHKKRPAYALVTLEVDENRLERLRELHRLGDG